MSKILIAGGSGLIGNKTTQDLIANGHEVIHLSRSPKAASTIPVYKWDIAKQYIDPEALIDVDYVINFAGAGIADKRWTDAQKKAIIDSRVHGNQFFQRLIEEKKLNIKKFISGAAIGYYGDRGSEILTEESRAGTSGFLVESCIQWEDSINAIKTTGVPVAYVRIGIVLSTKGGALEKMLGPAKFGLGSYFGDGSQIYSWVHIDDISKIFCWLVDTPNAEGVYNGTAPNPISNKDFVQTMMDVKGGLGIVAPVPKFVLSAMLGEMKAVVMTGSHVIPKKLEQQGFKFKYEELNSCLADLIQNEM
jgi:uncharacterized protein (TIGR01777 family)